MWRALPGLAVIVLLAAICPPGECAGDKTLGIDWPRQRVADDATILTIHRPQVDSWDMYVKLQFRAVVGMLAPEATEEVLGTIVVSADTDTDFDTRIVAIHNLQLEEINFPSMSEGEIRVAEWAIGGVLSASEQKMSLDEVLAYMVVESEEDGAAASGAEQSAGAAPAAKEIAASSEPPAIYVSESPAILILYDGEPILAPIEGTGLLFALNTNWDVFLDRESDKYYLRNEDTWLAAEEPLGPWSPAEKLPKGLSKLPVEQWEDVTANVPGKKISKEDVPVIYVNTRPAELILLDGEPALERIPDTQLSYVTNTDSDLFWQVAESQFYFLVSGRWLRAAHLGGPWTATNQILPPDFAAIPEKHPRGRVLSSVPGTSQAQEAIHLAQVPETAEVSREDTTIEVTYNGEPEFEMVEETTVEYAVNTSYDVFLVDNTYYACHQAIWFVSSSPHGPWIVATSIPETIYSIPPSSAKHNVTYVYIYDSSPTVVYCGYTAGYYGMYIWSGCVVYGTGYYYPPYYYPGYYPIYYPYPYSYGCGAYYNPYTGTYGRGAYAHGPYGGYGRGAAYNPRTGTYARGVAAYGPYQSARAGRAYNPRTGTYAAGYQRSTPYASWGEGVVQRGDDWVHGARYSDSRGTVTGLETSEGGRLVTGTDGVTRTTIGRTESGDLYAGRDGNVYKREDGEWYKGGDGEWSPIDKDKSRELADQQRQGGELSAEQRKAAEDRAAQRSRAEGTRRTSTERERTTAQSSNRSRTVDQLNKDAKARSQGKQRSKQYSKQRSKNYSQQRSRQYSSQRSRSSYRGGSRGGGRGAGRRR